MTPAQQAKAAGHKNLKDVCDSLGFTPSGSHLVGRVTLDRWAKHKPLLFAAVLKGCAATRT